MQRRFEFMGFRVIVDRNVYNPSSDSLLLADTILAQPKAGCVLELGCGCGLLSLVASRVADRVLAYDTSVYAFRNAAKNVRINRLDGKVYVFLGDGSDAPPVDMVVANPPYLPSGPLFRQDALSNSWNGGPDGLRVVLGMLQIAASKLGKGGVLLLVVSSLQRRRLLFGALRARGFEFSLVSHRSGFYERIEVYRCTKT